MAFDGWDYGIINWLKSTVSRLWRDPQAQEPAIAAVIEDPVAPVPEFPPIDEPEVAKVKRKYTRVEEDKSQAHYYLGDLLERLDDYFDDLEILRRGHPEMAANFEKFGVALMESEHLLANGVQPHHFTAKLPSQGCFFLGRNPDEGKGKHYTFRFVYFQKHNQPVNVQSTSDMIFTIGGVMGINKPHLFQCHIAVKADLSTRVLREIRPSQFSFGKGIKRAHLVRMEWGLPNWVKEVTADTNRKRKENLTVDEHITRLFWTMVNGAATAEFDMNVRVKKAGRVASFAINMLRTPYFFSDREKTVNEAGNAHKILHIVRTHERTTRDGTKKFIKAHWRGLRRFTWNGYDVSIGMPGAHFKPLQEWTAAAWEEADMKRLGRKDGIEITEAARRIDEAITAPYRRAS